MFSISSFGTRVVRTVALLCPRTRLDSCRRVFSISSTAAQQQQKKKKELDSPDLDFSRGRKVSELKELAIAVGASSTGNKQQISKNVRDAVAAARATQCESGLRLLSIDMGIRNLAYAFVVVPSEQSMVEEGVIPTLHAWRRLNVTSLPSKISAANHGSDEAKADILDDEAAAAEPRSGPKLGPFEPETMARHAYTFASFILSEYNPTHIIIERQRFRSGGASTVLEWSLRVGVFEGMLHALFQALAAERGVTMLKTKSIDPGRVTRFWLDKFDNDDDEQPLSLSTEKKKTKKQSETVKAFKIDVTARLLQSQLQSQPQQQQQQKANTPLIPPPLTIHPSLHSSILTPFLAKATGQHQHRQRKPRKPTTPNSEPNPPSSSSSSSSTSPPPSLDKIDDLADALLSAVTWLEWRNAAATMMTTLLLQGPDDGGGGGGAGIERVTARARELKVLLGRSDSGR